MSECQCGEHSTKLCGHCRAESVSPAPPSVNFIQRLGGTCFAHGEYGPEGCPKWPACATDPQIYKPVAAPKRYTPELLGNARYAGCVEAADGAYVLHSEYVSLREELDKALVLVEALNKYWMPTAKNEERLKLLAESQLADMRKALKEAVNGYEPLLTFTRKISDEYDSEEPYHPLYTEARGMSAHVIGVRMAVEEALGGKPEDGPIKLNALLSEVKP